MVALVAVVVVTGILFSPAARFRIIVKLGVKPVTEQLTSLVSLADTRRTFSTDMTLGVRTPSLVSSSSLPTMSGNKADIRIHKDEDGLNVDIQLIWEEEYFLYGFFGYSDGTAGVYLPDLDSNYYSADIAKLLSTLGIQIPGLSIDSSELQTMVESAVQSCTNIILDSITEDRVTARKGQDIVLAGRGETIRGCTVLSFGPTEEDLAMILHALTSPFSQSTTLHALMALESVLSDQGWQIRWLKRLNQFAASLDDYVNELAKSLAEMNIAWEIAIKGMKPIQTSIVIDGNALALEFFDTEDKVRNICLSAMQQESTPTVVAKLDYRRSETENVGNLVLPVISGSTFSWSFDSSQKSALGIPYGTYSLMLGSPDETTSLVVRPGLTDPTASMHHLEIPASSTTLLLSTTDKQSAITAPDIPGDVIDVTDFEFLLGNLIRPWLMEIMN